MVICDFVILICDFDLDDLKKVNALARIASYMDESKRILLMITFILSYFNYCPLFGCFVVGNVIAG